MIPSYEDFLAAQMKDEKKKEQEAASAKLYTPNEVAKLFGVDPKTVSRWANRKPPLIEFITTPGGHRRYKHDSLMKFYNLRVDDEPVLEADK